ncbi:MAG: glycosyl hydrolase [Eubacterium sp.]
MSKSIHSKRKWLLLIVLILVPAITASVLYPLNKKEPVISNTLSNQNADETTKAVYEYIASLQNKKVLSAQQESTWMGSDDYEMEYIYDCSGKYPAMRGLDYMNDDFEGVNRRAKEWWEKGGLVTICWHTGSDFSGAWEEAMNDEVADWDAMLTDGTAENKAMLEGMDKAAMALSELQEAGVTVIWRPFHEFDGQWFWWGKGGSESFIKLWQTMYDRYTNYWHLNNLIWVLGYSHNGEDYKKWYPGDEYCDIIGADSYDGGSQPKLFKKVKRINKANKPMCFHECGANPTAEELKETPWVWFMTWHTEYLTDYNDKNAINELYNSDYVITLDELNY